MVDHQYKFNVTMTCGGCSGAVERVLKKLDGMSLPRPILCLSVSERDHYLPGKQDMQRHGHVFRPVKSTY
jgi:copper chaperone CopZ